MKDCMDEFDRKTSDSTSHDRNSKDSENESLHLRVEMLEKELSLEGEGHTMSERISLIKESFRFRVGNLE
eukprot:9929151-Ditylum_brightwellii.AAC.1